MFSVTHFKRVYLCIVSLFLVILIILALCKSCGVQWVNADSEAVRVPVLMYHSVCINRRVQSEYIVTPDMFENDMKYLISAGYTPVFISEIYSYCRYGEKLPSKPIAITFDDGFLNNMTAVLPVLRKYGIKAEVNIVGSYTQKYSQTVDRNASYACLTWDDINILSESGYFEIGSHTWDMHTFGSRRGCGKKQGESEEEYRNILVADTEKINRALYENCSLSPVIYAFPYGEYSKNTREILSEQGYAVFLTCEEKINVLRVDKCEILSLGRINRSAKYSTAEFMKKYGL